MVELDVRPVTRENWRDFLRLFEARGAPHYCFCAPYRFTDAHRMGSAEKKASMHRLVQGSTPVGVLAYDGEEPVGWCSIAPRESYLKLERSRTMPRVTPRDTPTWTILCFFVKRTHRRKGVTQALVRGAIAYARAQGARVIEGYPFDTAGNTSTHRGHSSAFRSARFRQEGTRWFLPLASLRAEKSG